MQKRNKKRFIFSFLAVFMAFLLCCSFTPYENVSGWYSIEALDDNKLYDIYINNSSYIDSIVITSGNIYIYESESDIVLQFREPFNITRDEINSYISSGFAELISGSLNRNNYVSSYANTLIVYIASNDSNFSDLVTYRFYLDVSFGDTAVRFRVYDDFLDNLHYPTISQQYLKNFLASDIEISQASQVNYQLAGSFGYLQPIVTNNDIFDLLTLFFDIPMRYIQTYLNISVFNTTLFAILGSVVTIALAVWLVKRFTVNKGA